MTKDRRNLCLTRKTIAEIEQLRDEELRSFSTMGEILIREALANRRELITDRISREFLSLQD
jgi:hypothetical protein